MDLGLKDRVVIVTGGASGIGEAIVRALAAEGARPVIVDRDGEKARAVAAACAAHAIVVDLREDGACARVVEEGLRLHGRLDGVVNNAGVNDGVGLEQGSPERFRDSLRTNLHHYYDLAHHALPHLVASHGAIVNIASKVAVTGQGNTSGYAASKGAILGLTREWAAELASRGVRVNAIIPAEVMTPQYRSWLDGLPDGTAREAAILARIPLGHRLTRPEEVAAMACFLFSAQAAHITGQFLHVDGGYAHLDRALP